MRHRAPLVVEISIHVPREGDDATIDQLAAAASYFNPRPP